MYFKFKGNFLKREDSSHQHQSSSNLPKKIKKNIRRSYTVSELNALKMQIIYILMQKDDLFCAYGKLYTAESTCEVRYSVS
jgi:hypothetical protein